MIRRAVIVAVLLLMVSGPVYAGDDQSTVVKKEPVTGPKQKGNRILAAAISSQ